MAGTHSAGAKSEANAIHVGKLGSSVKKLLLQARSNVAYSAGHLLYVRDRVLVAHPFDAKRQRLAGDPFPIAEGVQYDPGSFRGVFSVSDNGVLAYYGGATTDKTQLRWFDLTGKEIGTLGEPASFTGLLSFSPDAKWLAATITDPDNGTSDLWLLDIGRGVRTRFTFGLGDEQNPVWSRDGQQIAYAATTEAVVDLYVKPSSGGGREQPLLRSQLDKIPTDWSPDARFLAYQVRELSRNGWDIWMYPFSDDRKPFPFLATEFSERGAYFSPDGRWIAYLSNESGKDEVYVAPFPGPGGKWQVSTGGGFAGRWSRNGKQVTYIAPDAMLMAVDVEAAQSALQIGTPRALFKLDLAVTGALHPSGDRVLLAVRPEGAMNVPITLVSDWTAGLEK